jgi:glycosyltransferase involved in cell wall biosynthesis
VRYYLIYKEEYPWDVRVEKIARTLSSNESTVSIIARNNNSDAEISTDKGIEIFRLPRISFFSRKTVRFLNLSIFFNPLWLFTMLKHVEKGSVLVVRDLPLVLSAYLVSKLKNSKIVFDMAECYPEMYKSMFEHSKISIFKKIVINSGLIEVYEKLACKISDLIFVMIEESRDRLIALGVSPNKIEIVSNTPQVSLPYEFVKVHSGEDLRLVYIGFLTKIRGLDVVISAIRKLIDMEGNLFGIRLDIIGKGEEQDYLLRLVDKLNLKENIFIHGWLDYDKAQQILNDSNVGVLTYRVCSHWNNTIPNKIFDYMSLGIPILATEVVPIQRIIEETESGLICRDQDTDDIAEKIKTLTDSTLRQNLGDNGIEAISSKYNWPSDSQKLLASITRII